MPPVLAFLKMGIHEDMTINDRILMDVWGRGGGGTYSVFRQIQM